MKMFIGDNTCDALNGKVIEVTNPATGELIDTVPDATKEDVDRAITLSIEGQREWAKLPMHKRAKILDKFVDLVMEEETRKRLAKLLSNEMGKPYKEAYGDFGLIESHFKGFNSAAQNILTGNTLPFGSEAGKEHDFDFTVREPIGTILGIIPFNAPPVHFAKKVAPALITGNAIILKPASDDPLTVLEFTRIIREAGVPGSVCQAITGRGSTVGNWLTQDSRISGVTFTGSSAVGREVAANIARNMKFMSMELGGNAPLIICQDADMDTAVKASLFRATYLSGQICNVAKRFIVHRSIKDAYVEKLVEALKKVKVGDPMDPDTQMGTLISEKAAIEVEKQVNLTVAQGARLIYGGMRKGAYYYPAVLDNMRQNMDIATDTEVFGPVFAIFVYDTIEEAVEIGNNTMYGLASGVITKDMKTAMFVATNLKAGSVMVNGPTNYRNLQTPWGGYKMSGYGREGQTATLIAMTQIKNIVFKDIL
jgi:succinate-semialdehyde dehydrogenase/glutarate-semialdehyde dehydrogenase